MSQAEFDYYAARSGLPASAKLEEHQRGFWCAQLSIAYPSLDRALGELELAFMVAKQPSLAGLGLSLNDARLRYFQIVSGLPAGLAATDYMQAFYLNPPPSETITLTQSRPNPVSEAAGNLTLTATFSASIPGTDNVLLIRRATAGGADVNWGTFGGSGTVWTTIYPPSAGEQYYWVGKHVETGVYSNELQIVVVA